MSPGQAVMAQTCPRCGVGPYRRCVTVDGASTNTHRARKDAAQTYAPNTGE